MFHPVNPGWQSRPGWSEFGAYRVGAWGRHAGFDYYVPRGTPVWASGEGVVVGIGYDASGYGHYVDIQYAFHTVRVAHLLQRTPLGMGSRVDAETRIGTVGQSGNAAQILWNGLIHPHVEVTVRATGEKVDPLSVLSEYDRSGLAGGPGIPIFPEEPEQPSIPEELEQDVIWLKHDSHEIWYIIAPGVKTQRVRDIAEARLLSDAILGEGARARRASSDALTALITRCEASIPERAGLSAQEIAVAVAAEIRADIQAVPASVVEELRDRL